MNKRLEPGLGELLRHLVEQLDRGSEEHYLRSSLPFRARYTPVMRALAGGSCCVSEITERVHITQGAVSQSIKLMQEDGLIKRESGPDARQSIVVLTAKGQKLLTTLQAQWAARIRAIEQLEEEIACPLRANLMEAVAALQSKGFSERLLALDAIPSISKVGDDD